MTRHDLLNSAESRCVRTSLTRGHTSRKQGKMTTEEFKEALKKGCMDFDIYGWEGILNCIILSKYYLLDDVRSRKPESELCKVYQDEIDELYLVLQERGHYDGYKA